MRNSRSSLVESSGEKNYPAPHRDASTSEDGDHASGWSEIDLESQLGAPVSSLVTRMDTPAYITMHPSRIPDDGYFI